MSQESKQRSPGRFKSSVLKWLGVPIGLTDEAFWAAWAGGASASGKSVTHHTILQLSAAMACVRLISQTIATLPVGFYERKPDGTRVSASTHPLYELLHNQPNADMTAVQFWEVVLVSLLLWGNAYAEKTFSGSRLVSLEFLAPQRMAVRRLTTGELEYRYTDTDGRQRVISERAIWHIRGFSVDGVMGLSAIRAGAQVFGAAMAADEASAKVFANGMSVGGVLSTDQILSDKNRNTFRTNMQTEFAGAMNTGKTMLLEAGMKYQQVPMNPEDAQLLGTRAFNVEEVCRWFGVPPFMVGHSEKSTSWGTGIEQQMIGFLTFSLAPWLRRIEQSIRKDLLQPVERALFFAEFSVEGLLRADSAARATFYSTMVQNGIYSRDDCREKENLPRRGGHAAELTVQSNLLPIDMLGSGKSSDQQARSALLDWLNSDGNNGNPT
ncbi:phage portal protein [Pseudoxanthomonas winnipegensis]|uniref:Phage portal protein n=1 Tax=Pseudoxanthomonas winnipegensis TaxID=2480810 RepID=A0A4Q8L9W1_9GAMM|nr:phage portal protein [Pseudoxanthomonas winnipegensis]RZZ81406.1 phage portal protein [Pseudoxanthomonas winnipegensis]TAA25401.1 phage portal protein [Pseudoxanthomonas winnipegensis]